MCNDPVLFGDLHSKLLVLVGTVSNDPVLCGDLHSYGKRVCVCVGLMKFTHASLCLSVCLSGLVKFTHAVTKEKARERVV